MKDIKKQLPKGWRWGRLKNEITNDVSLFRKDIFAEGIFKYIDISSIDNVTKRIIGYQELSVNDAPSRAKYILQENDIIIATVRPNLNAVAIVDQQYAGCIGSSGFCVVRLRSVHNPQYFFQYLTSPYFVDVVSAMVQGAMYPAINNNDVLNFEIPLPPTLDDQIAIANELERKMAEVEAMRQAALRQKDASVAMQRATLRNLFKDDQTKNWQKKTLGDVIRVSSGVEISFSKRTENTAIPVYGGNGIAGYADKCLFNEPKIVIGRVGAQCGNVNYTEKYSWITDNALYVKEKIFPVEDKFLIAVLNALNLNSYANRKSQPFISGSLIYPLEISIPPTATEQLAVADILERKMSEISKLKEATHIQFETIEALPGAILREVFDFGKN